jgi:hypothetical protein
MERLRTAPETITLAMKVRSEGLGIRATGQRSQRALWLELMLATVLLGLFI